jgi:hypothetical protein
LAVYLKLYRECFFESAPSDPRNLWMIQNIESIEYRWGLLEKGMSPDNLSVKLWRETEGWTKEDLERDQKFVAEKKLTEGADEVFVNGDSFIPKARALEPMFKARMFAPLES